MRNRWRVTSRFSERASPSLPTWRSWARMRLFERMALRPWLTGTWKAVAERVRRSVAACSRPSARRSISSSQRSRNTSRLEVGGSPESAKRPATASKAGRGEKRTVIKRSCDSTKPRGATSGAPPSTWVTIGTLIVSTPSRAFSRLELSISLRVARLGRATPASPSTSLTSAVSGSTRSSQSAFVVAFGELRCG